MLKKIIISYLKWDSFIYINENTLTSSDRFNWFLTHLLYQKRKINLKVFIKPHNSFWKKSLKYLSDDMD
jgi:hypothetical protein